jgi:hypothetical protein
MATPQETINSTNSLLERIKTEGITDKTGAIIPPSSYSKEIDTSQAPALNTKSGDISALGAGVTTSATNTIADLQKRLEELANQKPTTETTTEKKSIMDLITKREETKATQTSAEDLRKEAIQTAYAEMGVTPEQIQKIGGLIGEVTEFNKQLADLEGKKQNAISAIETRPGIDVKNMGAETNRITKAYNSEISAKSLQAGVKIQELQLIQGAYEDAKETASQLVELATYDQQQEVADIEWSIDAHQDLYKLMTTEEQTAWDKQYTNAKDTLATLKAEKTAISEIMMKPELSGAGVSFSDTLEEAQAKVSKYVGTSAYLNRVAQIGAAGRAPSDNGVASTTGIANAKVEASFREDGASLKQQVRAGALTNEEAYSQLRDLYSPTEVTDDYINNYLGITTTENNVATTENISTPTYGTGNFKNISLQDRLTELQNQNKKSGLNKNVGVRKQLINEGYDKQEVISNTPTVEENIGGFFQGIYNSIFGK